MSVSTVTATAAQLYQERAEGIAAAVRIFLDEHETWKAAKSTRPHVDKAYFDAFERALALISRGAIPASCRKLIDAFQRLEEEVEFFGEMTRKEPPNRFWAAVEALQSEYQTAVAGAKEWKHTQSPTSLAAEGVPHEQIASMFAISPEDLRRELENPGSIVDMETAVHPFARASQEDIEAHAADWAKLEEEERRLARQQEEFENRPASETPWQLWTSGVEVTQAAGMKKVSEAEMQAAYDWFANFWELNDGVPMQRARPVVDPATLAKPTLLEGHEEPKQPPASLDDQLNGPAGSPRDATPADGGLSEAERQAIAEAARAAAEAATAAILARREERAELHTPLDLAAVANAPPPAELPTAADLPTRDDPEAEADGEHPEPEIDEETLPAEFPEEYGDELVEMCVLLGVEPTVEVPEDYGDLKRLCREIGIETRGNPRRDNLVAKFKREVLVERCRRMMEDSGDE